MKKKLMKWLHNTKVKFYWDWVYPFWLARDAFRKLKDISKTHPYLVQNLSGKEIYKYYMESIWGYRQRFFYMVKDTSNGYLWIAAR